MDKYTLLFREEIKDQLNCLHDKQLMVLLNKMFDKMEILGPNAGSLIDSRRSLYEMKMKKLPLRLYYQVLDSERKILVFEFEMKTSSEKQQKTINKIKNELRQSKT